MAQLVAWLDHWQTLVGSVLGGVIALLAALIVAQAQTRREQRSAAILVLSDLLSVVTAARNLRSIATQRGISAHDYPLWLSEMLSVLKPKLSQVFDAEMIRVMDVHTSLTAHLSLFKTSYATIDDSLVRLQHDHEQIATRGLATAPRSPEQSRADAQAVDGALQLSAHHAERAIHYLERLVLSRTPTFQRLRMLIRPSPIEKSNSE